MDPLVTLRRSKGSRDRSSDLPRATQPGGLILKLESGQCGSEVCAVRPAASLLTKWRKGGAADSKESSVGDCGKHIAKELGGRAVKGFDRI